ncbi:MAG: FMN-binding negative transcriptional regulator [Geminicoccales bacterium]
MYVPKPFQETRTDVLHAAMREIGAAAIVGHDANGFLATHAPVELTTEPEPFGTIRIHFARANPHARAIKDGQELLLIFQGHQGYITPSWYPTKQLTGKVVPTWNYVAVHAYGTATVVDDAFKLRAHLAALTNHFENGYDQPWKIDDAPKKFIDGMCRSIIGFEITINRIEGKWKMSQNKSSDDRSGVIDGLHAQGDEAMAGLVEAAQGERKG